MGIASNRGRRWILLAPAVVLAGCLPLPSPSLPVPAEVRVEVGEQAARLDWAPVAAAEAYRIHWTDQPDTDPREGATLEVPGPPWIAEGIQGAFSVSVSAVLEGVEGPGTPPTLVEVAGSPERYFPPWHGVPAAATFSFDYDPGRTPEENAASLQLALDTLQAGDEIRVGGGVYRFVSAFRIDAAGTDQAPVRIVAKEGEVPLITRVDASQNTLEVGSRAPTRFLLLRGLEIVGGDIALRLHDVENVWVDRCHIHDCAQNAIAANTLPTAYLHFTRNEIHSTAGTGEGFYLGGNFGNPVTHHTVVALNHVHDTGGSQGDGIELKQGSWACWIVANTVHDTPYPCILVYGTAGREANRVERNVCWASGDNVLQVQGEALVQNNVLIGGLQAFQSGDHQDAVRDLVVVNNTMLNEGPAAHLGDWGGRPGMVFANNVVYSRFSTSLRFANGSTGVEVAGNVVLGPVQGVGQGFVFGNGLSDFLGASWDGALRDVTPAPGGALGGVAASQWAPLEDLAGGLRRAPFDAGAVEAP